MSSEMRVTDAMVTAALDAQPLTDENESWRVWQIIGFDNDRVEKIMRAALNAALLARTEAGADGAAMLVRDVCEMAPADPEAPDTVCIRVSDLTRIAEQYTRPQDASGDAEIAVAALREIYETGMYPEGHTLAGEHAYKGEYHADCIGIAERALAAMQAKEAK